jgi:hypothetical protein
MKLLDLTHISDMNTPYRRKLIKTANGLNIVVLDLLEQTVLDAKDVLYLHIHRESKRCYVGQALKQCKNRWGKRGTGYKLLHQPKFRSAIDHYGWEAFDSFIVAFCKNQELLDSAETECISALGGHRSEFLFNLAPGGRVTVDRSQALEGCNLKTKEWRYFKNSVEAAEYIGIQKAGNIRRVVTGENKSAGGWWFRLADSDVEPPIKWGLGSAVQKTRPVFGIRLADMVEFNFDSISSAGTHLGAHTSNITRVVKGKGGGTCNGYWLKYADSDAEMPKLVGRAGSVYKNGKPVVAINKTTGESRYYLSGRSAAEDIGVDRKNIPGALKGRIKSLGGWIFRYASPSEISTNTKKNST